MLIKIDKAIDDSIKVIEFTFSAQNTD